MISNNLNGKVALVTGASGGLGEHFSLLLASHGASVAIAARRVKKLKLLSQRIEDVGGSALVVDLDVTDADSVNAAIESITENLGAIDVLINNAGIADSRTFIKLDESSWNSTLNVNLTGAWRVAHRVSQDMVKNNVQGCIVNISSILGMRSGFGHSAYSVSKAGVVQLTKSMALELGRKGIRVNALCPGYFETDINAEYFATKAGAEYLKGTPAGRAGKLTELDAPLMLLCTDAGSFINGVALPVDGGHLVDSL